MAGVLEKLGARNRAEAVAIALPCIRTSTRSTSNGTIRACSAGKNSSHSGSSCSSASRLVLGDVVLLGPRRTPCGDDDLRLPKDAAQLVDDHRLDLGRQEHADRARIRPTLQHVLANVVAVSAFCFVCAVGDIAAADLRPIWPPKAHFKLVDTRSFPAAADLDHSGDKEDSIYRGLVAKPTTLAGYS